MGKEQFDQADNEGITPLHDAALNGHLEVVQWLVMHGAVINQINRDGDTPLALAVSNGHLEVVQWLQEQEIIKQLDVTQSSYIQEPQSKLVHQQHFSKIANIVEGKAFASSWAHSGQIIGYLNYQLTKVPGIIITPEVWGMHANEAVHNVVGDEDFPHDSFLGFLRNLDQERFLLPVMLRNNHFAGEL